MLGGWVMWCGGVGTEGWEEGVKEIKRGKIKIGERTEWNPFSLENANEEENE